MGGICGHETRVIKLRVSTVKLTEHNLILPTAICVSQHLCYCLIGFSPRLGAAVAPGMRERRAISFDASNLNPRKRQEKAKEKQIPLADAIAVHGLISGKTEQRAVGIGAPKSTQGQPDVSIGALVDKGAIKLI